MELRQKDSKLQFTQSELGEARHLTKDAKTECDRERATFQAEQESLLCDLKQAQVDKVETEKAGYFMAKVQKEVQVYKRLKYEQGYKDRAQGKSPRYPLEVSISRGYQSVYGSLASDDYSPSLLLLQQQRLLRTLLARPSRFLWQNLASELPKCLFKAV